MQTFGEETYNNFQAHNLYNHMKDDLKSRNSDYSQAPSDKLPPKRTIRRRSSLNEVLNEKPYDGHSE